MREPTIEMVGHPAPPPRPSNGADPPDDDVVTARQVDTDVPTIDVVGVAQVRRKLAKLQTQAEKSDRKVSEINEEAKKLARRAKEAKAGLATLSRR
jgi:hypothetical protein